MSAFGLAREPAWAKEAQEYIGSYFERHRAVRSSWTVIEGPDEGFVGRTAGGCGSYRTGNSDPAVRQLGGRVAMNTPIQGTAADIIKMAMISIHRAISSRASLRGLSSRYRQFLRVAPDETDR